MVLPSAAPVPFLMVRLTCSPLNESLWIACLIEPQRVSLRQLLVGLLTPGLFKKTVAVLSCLYLRLDRLNNPRCIRAAECLLSKFTLSTLLKDTTKVPDLEIELLTFFWKCNSQSRYTALFQITPLPGNYVISINKHAQHRLWS